jgi:hypothetical protein
VSPVIIRHSQPHNRTKTKAGVGPRTLGHGGGAVLVCADGGEHGAGECRQRRAGDEPTTETHSAPASLPAAVGWGQRAWPTVRSRRDAAVGLPAPLQLRLQAAGHVHCKLAMQPQPDAYVEYELVWILAAAGRGAI